MKDASNPRPGVMPLAVICAIGLVTITLFASGRTQMSLVWGSFAVSLVLVAGALGEASHLGKLGILIDSRGRYSLTHLQLALWSITVISLVGAVVSVRMHAGVPDAMRFEIPSELLLVMGISVGSTVLSGAAKNAHDAAFPARVAVSDPRSKNVDERPSWTQLFLQDEGAGADTYVDISKFQNFMITVVAVIAYCTLVVQQIGSDDPADITKLPGFADTLVVLIAVSHAGHFAAKLPTPVGMPPRGTTVLQRNQALARKNHDESLGPETVV